MKIADYLHPESVCADLKSTGKLDVLQEMGALLSNSCPTIKEEEITTILVERERLATTGIGEGVAIPHGKIDNLGQLVAALGISHTGIGFDAVDGNPVHIFVALLAPQSSTGEHLKALAQISRILKDISFRNRLLEKREAKEVYDAIIEEDGK